MWGVLEGGRLQDEHEVPLGVVSADESVVATARLLEGLSIEGYHKDGA